jgi:pyruvate/2-oxoglutarate/acetoin dehydrogenase E1 component
MKNSNQRLITYAEAINEGLRACLQEYQNVIVFGLGVTDPKAIFGTTRNLQAEFGTDRVFDTPLSENATTGIALGCATTGLRPILIHQRVDFALVSIEQIVNQAAKWSYMFGGRLAAPMVIRMIIGRGWGQGPQHSQSLQSWFAHIPGLKVLMPASAYDAKGMLISAVEDDNPVIILEHRWLYAIHGNVPDKIYRVPIGKASIIRKGLDITLIGISYMTIICLKAAEILNSFNIDAEVIDLRSISPFDREMIIGSVSKTKRVIIVDNAHLSFGVASEISSFISEEIFSKLLCPPKRIGFKDYPTPTSKFLSDDYYPVDVDVVRSALQMLGINAKLDSFSSKGSRDQPDPEFTGPF